MRRFRLTVVLLLSLALPLGASAGLRVPVGTGHAAMVVPAARSAAAGAMAGPCAMMDRAAALPAKPSAPCCPPGCSHDCQICALALPLVPGLATACPLAGSQGVAAAGDVAVRMQDPAGRWRPPRQG